MEHWGLIAMNMQEHESDSRLASILGISEDELGQLTYDIEAESSDDTIYGYIVEFFDPSPKKILKKISRLEQGRYVSISLWEMEDYDDYGQDDYDEQYDAILSEKDYYQKFINEIDSLRQLNEVDIPTRTLEAILKRQIFISVIGAVETFLSDTFISLTFDNDDFFRNFIETHPEFKQRKFELREIFTETEKLKDTAKKVMLDTIYHNLPTIRQMFNATFKISFPSIKIMNGLVLTRHDLVHRNGKTKDGIEIILDTEEIEKLIDEAIKFVNDLSASIQKIISPTVFDDPNDDLPF